MSYPSVYPTGVTVYNPKKCWSGYTIFPARELGAMLIDMNGTELQLWKGLHGFPNKILPGGYVMGQSGERNNAFGMQDLVDLVQVDWDGNIVWKFDRHEYIEDPGEEPRWMARQHHDYQREGNPVGYYVPGMEPKVDGGNTLILVHKNVKNPKISDKVLLDDSIIEVDWEGNIIWEWNCHEHFDEYEFSEEAKNVLFRDPNMRSAGGGMGDWMHINSMSVLGPNKWYDAGDERFHPDNIIWDAREANILAIISKKTGKVVWKIGPDYNATKELKKLGWIIGQHHVHMIPRGLPGEGNILIFDNGGWGGYGAPNPSSPIGRMNALRDYSRVLEIDPTTLEIVWQYTPAEAGFIVPVDASRFYSPFISGAQRLPNGNTLITEGSGGRLIEVTEDHEIVWEYISPYWGKQFKINMIYRAYRVPYEWIPQLDRPQEVPIERIEVKTYRVPGAAPSGCKREVKVPGVIPFQGDTALCVAAGDEVEDNN
ncbi:aryl-sulfate sulfotransferase [Desulfotomaculum defluvii]